MQQTRDLSIYSPHLPATQRRTPNLKEDYIQSNRINNDVETELEEISRGLSHTLQVGQNSYSRFISQISVHDKLHQRYQIPPIYTKASLHIIDIWI